MLEGHEKLTLHVKHSLARIAKETKIVGNIVGKLVCASSCGEQHAHTHTLGQHTFLKSYANLFVLPLNLCTSIGKSIAKKV